MSENVENCIQNNIVWAKLPQNVKQHLGNSQKEYEKAIVSYCIKTQTRYKGSLVRHVRRDEKVYYEELLKFSKDHFMLFPYHLNDVYVKGLRITSFTYYIDMLCALMTSERSYDTLPNFTAADCLRLIGIGRNQYIDLMNKYRSTKRLFTRRKPVRDYLPKQPLDIILIEPWWYCMVGYVTEEDVKLLNTDEKLLIDKLIDNNDQSLAGSLNYDCIQSLYRKGLIYLHVPINDNDYIQVPPLENFVMNRTLGDYFEQLLYKLFVSIDERTCISELASILQINLDLVKNAVSLYCRLGFAKKTNVSNEYTDESWKGYKQKTSDLTSTANTSILAPTIPASEDVVQIDEKKLVNTEVTNECVDDFFMPETVLQSPQNLSTQNVSTQDFSNLNLNKKRLGFLFDSTLTAFLMMGNLSVGLKNHAVTMFEVGKLSDQSLDNFLSELDKISTDEHNNEGDAQRYFDHAIILKTTLQFLRYNKELKIYSDCNESEECDDQDSVGIDLLRVESLSGLEVNACKRILARNYSVLVSIAPYSGFGESQTSPPISFDSPYHLGPIIPEVNSVWFKFFIYSKISNGPLSLLIPRGYRLKYLPKQFQNKYERFLITSWGHEPFITTTQANILLTLNDALTHSPLLVQAYGIDVHDGNIVHVAFNDTTHELFNNEIVKNLHDTFNLKYFSGYISLLSTSPNNWCLLDIRFGIPLFDLNLNLKILNLIKENKLLSKTNLNSMLQYSKEMMNSFLNFIHDYQMDSKFLSNHNTDMNIFKYITTTTKLTDCNVETALFPTQCILFDQTSVSIWNQ